VLAFAFCFDELMVALFLNDSRTVTLPVQIFSSARESLSPAISAASVLVTVVAIAALGFVGVLRRPRAAR